MGLPPPIPEYQTAVKIFYFDTDAAGVVHNVAYLRMVEVARTELADHLGWTLEEMRDTGLVPVVARTEIDYLKPARLGDTLVIKSSLKAMEKIRFYLDFSIELEEKRIAFCRQTMVTVQLPGGRPKPVPESWQKSYPQLTMPSN